MQDDPAPMRAGGKVSRHAVNEQIWRHHTLDTAADLEAAPPAMSPADAQAWCNFVLFAPGNLPAGTELARASLRREAPPGRDGDLTVGRTSWSENNPAAYRFEASGGGRALRVKQFLYDWAFPALDHPALWESSTSAVPIDDEHVLWYGTDYMGHQAASARMARTMVELSVLRGTFADDEILDFYRSLRAVDDIAAVEIANTPFADLGYWARRPEATAIAVPLGLWNIHQPDTIRLRWSTGRRASEVLTTYHLPKVLGDLPLDSAATDEGKALVAAEVVYTGGSRRGRELRLHVYRNDHDLPHPERERHPGHDEPLSLHGRRVHLAWIDDRHGPFDAIITTPSGKPSLRLLSSTGVGCHRTWFLGALNHLLDGMREA